MNEAVFTEATGPLQRAVSLLRLLASHGRRGLSLSEISGASGLPHPTVHRLLNQLVGERLVQRHPQSRKYILGALTFELGVAAAQQFDIRDVCNDSLARLALDTGETSYLVMRSGDEAVCIDRQEGHAPIRVMSLNIGSRRLLGVGAGGLAILAAFHESEWTSFVEVHEARFLAEWKLSSTMLLQSIRQARENGYALIRNRITLGTTAVGCPICDTFGNPLGSISIAAINERMDGSRTHKVGAMVMAAAKDIEALLRRTSVRRLVAE